MRAARHSLEESSGSGSDSADLQPVGSPDTWLLEFTRRAMACDWEVLLEPEDSSSGAEAAVEVLEHLETLEDRWSVFRQHSLMSQVNQRAAEAPVVVDEQTFAMLRLGVEIHQATRGAFEMTAGPLTRAWGFFRREGRFPSPAELEESLQRVGSGYVQLDEATRAVSFTRSGVEINLGGIGKGFALDCCVDRLQDWGVRRFLFHGGQSSVVARGERRPIAGAERGEPWVIGLRHPIHPGTRLAEIPLRDEALGTSGTNRQHFYHGGRRYGHILDPRTGFPAEGVLSATVIAPTAAQADAWATACYVLGPERSLELLASHPELSALLVVPGGSADQIRCITAGPAAERWRILAD